MKATKVLGMTDEEIQSRTIRADHAQGWVLVKYETRYGDSDLYGVFQVSDVCSCQVKGAHFWIENGLCHSHLCTADAGTAPEFKHKVCEPLQETMVFRFAHEYWVRAVYYPPDARPDLEKCMLDLKLWRKEEGEGPRLMRGTEFRC